jgi:hypothetical protein
MALTDTQARILDFERGWWRYVGNKEQSIRDLFAMSATSYYAEVNRLIDEPAALEADPMLVLRLRRIRDRRRVARSARALVLSR